ncbi:MAG: zf-HC2 domain-containing protein [Pseudohongiella sp.]|jgi:hypothetical protein|nr:zf-HC2 domain-containing protein [Pseudohongiella sp.]
MTKVTVMPSNSESQCYFVQLQIDGYIDGDLNETQREVFTSHVHSCEACAQEFHYAQVVQDTFLELPQIDCDELVLEPIHRLSKGDGSGYGAEQVISRQSLLSQIRDLFISAPAFMRYGFPVVLTAVLAVLISTSVLNQDEVAPFNNQQLALESVEIYSPEEVFQALQDLNLAIDYLNQMGKRTEAMIGGRFLLTPLQDSINASFEKARIRNDEPLQNDPI